MDPARPIELTHGPVLFFRSPTAILVLLVAPAWPARAQTGPGSATIESLLSRSWEHKLISSGDNFPSVNLGRERRADLVVLLHFGIPADSIRRHFGWSGSELQARVEELVDAGLVRPSPRSGPLPTVLVMSAEDVRRHMPVAEDLVEETAAMIAGRLDEVRRLHARAPGLSRVPFEDVSLLLLSDVVLDNWQINAVEERFLGAERPLRDGKRYYFSLQEDDTGDAREAFGIYGNQYRRYGRHTVGVYGNRRTGNPLNFLALGKAELENLFGTWPDTVAAFKREALGHLVSDPSQMPAAYRAGFEAIGWMRTGEPVIPILHDADLRVLDQIAALFTDDLVALLERHRPELERLWTRSAYSGEVTFEEYFIWWYHLYYTAVTDRMAERGMLIVPDSGIASYVMAGTS